MTITVRLRGPSGTFRIQSEETADISTLYTHASQKEPTLKSISNQLNFARPFPKSGKTISQLGIKHGDMLFISTEGVKYEEPPKIEEHEVDKLLSKETGLIKRQKDPNFCRHGNNGMCDYCLPLEPYDEKYLASQKIKHMSFQAYLRKLGISNSSSSKPPVVIEEPSYKVKAECDTGHAPYPQAMCAKCQPSAVVLQQQPFRFVDHVEFEDPSIVDSFIGFWRGTALQRFGYLYGRYEKHVDVPLGIKAVVSAIYEPPQKSFTDGVELIEDELVKEQSIVDDLALELGLEKVGMIYTDLTDAGEGKVICKRHLDSFFVSSVETVFIAREQLYHKNPCKHSKSGFFGSKFATVIVSGDTDGNIHLSAFQVSTGCMAMVEDEIIDASTNPHLMLVQESTPTHYVPEVFFKYKNKYGAQVQEPANPSFPVDYLLVTEGFPQVSDPLFKIKFPIENRNQSFKLVNDYNDFHLLLYLKKTDLLGKEVYSHIIECVTRKLVVDSEVTRRIESLFGSGSSGLSGGSSVGGSGAGFSGEWICAHCTFINGRSSECEMCGLPRQ